MKSLCLFLLGLWLFLVSCEKRNDFRNNSGRPSGIVVESVLTDEMKYQQVSLTLPMANLNDPVLPVSGATVIISDEDSVYYMHENPAGSGRYLSQNPFAAVLGKHYTLKVMTGNSVYTAKAGMVPGMGFLPLRYVRNGSGSLFRIVWVSNPYNPNRPAMYEVRLDWSQVPGYQHLDPDSCKALMMVYTLPTLDVSEVFAPAKEKILFPVGTKITELRYSLSSDHAAFLREMLLETAWQGGFFNTAPANVITNISGGAFGFFGVCAVTKKEILVGK